MFSVGSGGFARPSGAFGLFAASAQKHVKTRANAALGPLGAGNGLLRPARVPPLRSKACFSAAGALEMAALACPGDASPLEKSVRACFGATSALRKSCLSLLPCRQSARRGCLRLLFKIAIRKCCYRLHCALSHCTLHCFAPCMDMHGSTLVFI